MMATTHGLAGLLLGALLSPLAPEQAPALMAAGLVGGLAPDLDLYAGHRRTLHFPVYGPLVALPVLGVALLVGTPTALVFGTFLAAAAAHAAMDVLGGGLELRPWEAGSERAVYSHFHDRWLAPRRWITYDGSPQDLALAVGLGLPALAITDGSLQLAIAAGLAVSTGYAALRKRLATVATVLAGLLPAGAAPYVPDRYLSGGNSRASSASRRE